MTVSNLTGTQNKVLKNMKLEVSAINIHKNTMNILKCISPYIFSFCSPTKSKEVEEKETKDMSSDLSSLSSSAKFSDSEDEKKKIKEVAKAAKRKI